MTCISDFIKDTPSLRCLTTKVGNLTFKLQLPRSTPSYLLESAMPGTDPYGRSTDRDPPPEEDEHMGSSAPSYEIERLLDKRIAHDRP